MIKYIIAALIVIGIAAGGFVIWKQSNQSNEKPDCDLAACPSDEIPSNCGVAGCPNGYTCIQECGPPVVSDMDPPPGYYCERSEVANQPRNCPICLDSRTLIATPAGEVPVTEIKVGTVVWTQDSAGNRIAAAVQEIGHTRAPSNHHMIHLVLDDGRDVSISPNHPLTNDRTAAQVRPGGHYDGSTIVSVERTKYNQPFTYDLLPTGETGIYWGDGIPLKSTLE